MRKALGVLLLVLFVSGVVFALNLLIFIYSSNRQGPRDVSIEPGRSFASIVQDLKENGIVSQDFLFKTYVLLRRETGKIRAGDYQFPEGVTPQQVLAMLRTGDFARIRVTLIEGWTLRDIAHALAAHVEEQAFLAKANDPAFTQTLGLAVPSLEGYLFPDTYELYKPKGPEELLQKFVQRFQQVYGEELQGGISLTGLSQHQVVTLASIVEKETARVEEAPLIAGLLQNRLRLNMPLAVDPTVIYGIPNFSGNITKQDLARPGPYNTYLNPGLPPSPISNPGRIALRAVLFPAQTEFLYFVSRGDGTHEFSKTFEEHQRAVYKYQILKQKPESGKTTGTAETAPSTRPYSPSGQ